MTPESGERPFRCHFFRFRCIEIAYRAVHRRTKKSADKSQIPSGHSDTPSLIRTIPSVPEFHRTPRMCARGLSPPIGNSCFSDHRHPRRVTLPWRHSCYSVV